MQSIKKNLILGSQSAFTALATTDVLTHLNITDASQTAYVGTLLQAAVVFVEQRLGLDLRPTTWTLVCDQFPGLYYFDPTWDYYATWANYEGLANRHWQRRQQINLERGPLATLNGITYFDASNNLQTYPTTSYAYSQPTFFPGVVEPTSTWPIAYSRPDAVSISFTTGLATVPANVLHAIKLLCGSWYSAREDISYGPGTAHGATGMAVDALLDQFTVMAVG